jgi:hypothetical protein
MTTLLCRRWDYRDGTDRSDETERRFAAKGRTQLPGGVPLAPMAHRAMTEA